MSGAASSNTQVDKALKALDLRARQILKARSAYREIVTFYLTVFRRQIEWRDRLVVRPQAVEDDQRRQCLSEGKPLIECFDPGLEPESLLGLWTEMKVVFCRGNAVIRQAVDKIHDAEEAGDFVPATWLAEQRPDRCELVTDVAGRLDVEESVLATLARAATFPHWELVAEGWLSQTHADQWKRFCCPTCGSVPGLVELRTENGGSDNLKAAPRRFFHCPFCGSRWAAPGLRCPACDSTQPGDAKYYYTPDEPELRIDFCKSCNHYVKVVDADKIAGRLHIGLELLTTAHLDAIAQEKNLTPLEICA